MTFFQSHWTKQLSEYCEFVVDCDVDCTENDAVKFWLNVYNMKSPMGAHKYKNLATTALTLVSIPASNADCERVFSHMRRIKTDFRSSVSTETISSLAISNVVNTLSLKTLLVRAMYTWKKPVLQEVKLVHFVLLILIESI